ncbi:MAG: sigma 54-interacting transcriptional regulator [Polyangiaceae bacterium]|nr:sigma 54-interacting transcriptional regulator [Polyangiaceae bacterium]
MHTPETFEQLSAEFGAASARRRPGLLLVHHGRPLLQPYPLRRGSLSLGRGTHADVGLEDGRVSREHARVSYDGRRWTVEDLGSRNGTYVDGNAVERYEGERPRVVRVGDALFVPAEAVDEHDAEPLRAADRPLAGAALRAAWARVDEAARGSANLLILGESGAGKEVAARRYHAAGPLAQGPFVAVNCATVPRELAERLLFGARRGAFSGAVADAEGYLAAADGGTLFLDELPELELPVQAKLLRALETGEFVPLGATRPKQARFSLCCAAQADPRDDVAEGAFRADLYYRIATFSVRLPPLRERGEEISWLVCHELARQGPGPEVSASFVEACLSRPWPGNVRELFAAVRAAATEARLKGASALVRAHLDPRAGTATVRPDADARASEVVAADVLADRAAVENALRAHHGNVAACARALGVHRNQLRRWLAKGGPRGQVGRVGHGPGVAPRSALRATQSWS